MYEHIQTEIHWARIGLTCHLLEVDRGWLSPGLVQLRCLTVRSCDDVVGGMHLRRKCECKGTCKQVKVCYLGQFTSYIL